MSDWTNLRDVMKDLSLAQGRRVPASLKAVAHTAPPIVNLEEETDEEYYKSNGDIDFSKPPDFSLIQKMLCEVKDKNKTTQDDIILNSELNPLSPVFVPSSKSDAAFMKIKRERNVAISSILKAQRTNSPVQVANILKSPRSMFKKRTTPSKVKKETTVYTSLSDTAMNGGKYIPSALANVYYNKYLANSHTKEQIKEDLWSRIEKKINEIDEKRAITQRLHSSTEEQECNGDVSNGSESVSRSSGGMSVGSSTSSNYGLDVVSLLHHRHIPLDSAADCVVCDVIDKHGYSFKEEND